MFFTYWSIIFLFLNAFSNFLFNNITIFVIILYIPTAAAADIVVVVVAFVVVFDYYYYVAAAATVYVVALDYITGGRFSIDEF